MIGKQIANFRILDQLGEGGMGVVFKAVDMQLDRPVAIKMLNADLARNPEVVERFRAEAKAQANLNHVNLATLYAFLVDQGNAFMVMEFVDGETLERLISRRGPIAPEEAVPWFKQALLGIGAAHRAGVVHRDIKPSNLMLNRQGIVKVMDFGIAKVLGTRGMTRTGMLQPGTLAYMAPEQIQNRQIDGRADIYALGITLYQMLSGHVPFESTSDFEMMNDHITATPPPMVRLYPYAPVQYQNAVMKALEKNPDNRYQTVEEFGAALEHPESVPQWTGATVPAAERTTVMVGTTLLTAAGTAAAPARAPSPAAPVISSQVQPAGAPVPAPAVAAPAVAGNVTWSSRYIAAAAIAGVAVILLAILVMARKPPVAQPPSAVGTAPAAAVNSPLTMPQVEVTTTGQSNPLTPQTGDGSPNFAKSEPGESPRKPETQPGAASRPQRPSADTRELDEVEHRIDQLSSRAAAVTNSLDRLHEQQAAAGYGLRGDIASTQASMHTNLAKAQAAIGQRDIARAKRYAGLVAADVEVLERFLGR